MNTLAIIIIILIVNRNDSTGRLSPEVQQSGFNQQKHGQEITEGEFTRNVNPGLVNVNVTGVNSRLMEKLNYN